MTFSWRQLPRPIFALAPMDGVTDAVYRTMVYRHGPPDALFTEFVSVEGLSRKIPALFNDLKYESHERPMIAQIYGYEPEAFRRCIPILAELEFDGVDINMGCPAKSVVHGGGGAALIKTCPHAKTIIKTCSQALKEWSDETGKYIPLSVKTRLGYDRVLVKDWIGQLLECRELSNISIHGRTLKQGYSGSADWEAIGEAVELSRGSGIGILGNGDLQSFPEAMERIRQTGVEGVLFGRATFGNPWFFREKERYRKDLKAAEISIALQERFDALLEHARLLHERKDPKHFIQIRKHAGWYLKGFPGASELRNRLVRVNSLSELELTLADFTARAA
jgi:nifR3 family TIM-barrel protein